MPGRPDAPRPIPPKMSVPGAVQPQAGNAFTLPAQFPLKPRGSGQPLPPAIQKKMESFFNTSFADVRIHVGSEAASIGALAFTHGPDLYFAPGQYNPQSAQGQQLLGHELTHVVQQRAGRVRNPLGSGIAVVQDIGLEAEAERMGQQAATQPAQVQPSMRNSLGSGIAGFPTPSGLNTGNGSATPKTVAGPVDRSGSVQRAATGSSRGMALAPILPSNPRLGRAPVQMRQGGNRSPVSPAPLNPAAIQPMISALMARTAMLKPIVPARPGLVQPKVGNPVIFPPSAGGRGVIQRDVDWNALTHSEKGNYGIKEKDRTKLYGLPGAASPEPARLYQQTKERDSSRRRNQPRRDITVWVPNVEFINKPELYRSRKWDWLKFKSTERLDREFHTKLKRKFDRIDSTMKAGVETQQGATLGAFGVNDCGFWAGVLRDMIRQEAGIPVDPSIKSRDFNGFGQNRVLPEPEVHLGGMMIHKLGAAQSQYHAATVVATDGHTLVTLEGHVEKKLKKPEFFFRAGLAGFVDANNTGRRYWRDVPNMHLESQGQKGFVWPLAGRSQNPCRKDVEQSAREGLADYPDSADYLSALLHTFAIHGDLRAVPDPKPQPVFQGESPRNSQPGSSGRRLTLSRSPLDSSPIFVGSDDLERIEARQKALSETEWALHSVEGSGGLDEPGGGLLSQPIDPIGVERTFSRRNAMSFGSRSPSFASFRKDSISSRS